MVRTQFACPQPAAAFRLIAFAGTPSDLCRHAESYSATLAHELVHWTKTASRLDRSFGSRKFADEGYAREELVAEIGAAFLCCDLGITPEPRDDHAAYLGNWLKVLKEDKWAIFQAAAHAQKAVGYLHHLQPEIPQQGIALGGQP